MILDLLSLNRDMNVAVLGNLDMNVGILVNVGFKILRDARYAIRQIIIILIDVNIDNYISN
jgi:hypothetical protein